MLNIPAPIKHILTGLAVTVLAVLGANLVGLGATTDLTEWGRTLLIAEAGAVGAYLVNTFGPLKSSV